MCGGDTKHSVLSKGGRGQKLSCLSSVQIKARGRLHSQKQHGDKLITPSRRPGCTTGVPAAPGPKKKFLCGCLWAPCVYRHSLSVRLPLSLVILYLALSSFFDKQMMPKQFVVAGVRDDDERLGGVVILDIRFFFASFLPAGSHNHFRFKKKRV